MQVSSFNIVFSYTVCSPVLWIRLQIGSIFSNLVDPDPYSEHGSRSGYTQTQTDINSPSQSKLSLCAFNFVLYSLKQVFWINKLYKKIDNELCEKVRFRIQIGVNVRIWIQIKYIWIHNTDVLYCEKYYTYMCIVQYRFLSFKTNIPRMNFFTKHAFCGGTPSCWFRWLVSARPTRFFLVNEHVRVRCWVGWVDFGYEIYQITNFYLILLLYIQRFVSIIILWFFL